MKDSLKPPYRMLKSFYIIKMDIIEGYFEKDKFIKGQDCPNIKINGVNISELLSKSFNDEHTFNHLIPTIQGMDNIEEERVSIERFKPKEGQSTNAPILMCPDDVDFACIVVIAEIHNLGDRIVWKQFGIDRSEDTPNLVGTNVEWIGGPELQFTIESYNRVCSFFDSYRENWEKENMPDKS